ncbi:MAG: hypothetical protein AAB415_00620 [Patescibacteria group bacterium]
MNTNINYKKIGIIAFIIILVIAIFSFKNCTDYRPLVTDIPILNNEPESGWRVLDSSSDGADEFVVDMPDYLFQEADTADDPLYSDAYTSEDKHGNIYSFTIRKPASEESLGNVDQRLKNSLNKVLGSDNKLLFSSRREWEGRPSLEFVMYDTAGSRETFYNLFYTKGRIVLAGEKIYILAVGYWDYNYHDGNFYHFINSFVLNDNNMENKLLDIKATCEGGDHCLFEKKDIALNVTVTNTHPTAIGLHLEFIQKTGPTIKLIDTRTGAETYLKKNLADPDFEDKITLIQPGKSVAIKWVIQPGDFEEFTGKSPGNLDIAAEIIIDTILEMDGNKEVEFRGGSTVRIIGGDQ